MSEAFFRSVRGLSNEADQVTVLMERIKQLQQELDAARRDFIYEHGERIKGLEQLADAKAQIADYEAALTELVAQGQRTRQTSLFWCEGPRQVLNKWKGKG